MSFSALTASLANPVTRDSNFFIAPFSPHLLKQRMYLATWLTPLQLFLEAFPCDGPLQITFKEHQLHLSEVTDVTNWQICEERLTRTTHTAVNKWIPRSFSLLWVTVVKFHVYLITPQILDFFPCHFLSINIYKRILKAHFFILPRGAISITQSNIYSSTK